MTVSSLTPSLPSLFSHFLALPHFPSHLVHHCSSRIVFYLTMTDLDNRRKLQVTFKGEVNCYLVHKTLEHCNCPTCRNWIHRENAEHFLDDTKTFGYITLRKDVPEESFYICSNHILDMNLVPHLGLKRDPPMTMIIHGNDQESTWNDQVAVGSKILGIVSIKVYSHVVQESPLALKQDGVRSPSRLKLTFRGPQRCFFIFSTVSDCRCNTCRAWIRCERSHFLDKEKNKYGLIPFEQVPLEVREYDFCWDHEMRVRFDPWPNRDLLQARRPEITLRGWKQSAVYRDSTKLETGICEMRMEICCVNELPDYSDIANVLSTSQQPDQLTSGSFKKGRVDTLPSKLDETKLSERPFTTADGLGRYQHLAEIYNDEPPDYHDIDRFSGTIPHPSREAETETAAAAQSGDRHFPDQGQGHNMEDLRLNATTSCSSPPPNKLGIRYVGSRKGLLAFHTKSHCSCAVCNDWTSLQNIPFKNDKGSYGVIPFKRRSDDRDVDICPNHFMIMGVVPWSDRYNTDRKDMCLEVSGQDQNGLWRDIVGDDVDSCKIILKSQNSSFVGMITAIEHFKQRSTADVPTSVSSVQNIAFLTAIPAHNVTESRVSVHTAIESCVSAIMSPNLASLGNIPAHNVIESRVSAHTLGETVFETLLECFFLCGMIQSLYCDDFHGKIVTAKCKEACAGLQVYKNKYCWKEINSVMGSRRVACSPHSHVYSPRPVFPCILCILLGIYTGLCTFNIHRAIAYALVPWHADECHFKECTRRCTRRLHERILSPLSPLIARCFHVAT